MGTLLGGGLAPAKASARPMAKIMPQGVKWLQDSAVSIDPDQQVVTTEHDVVLGYDALIVAPGIQLDFTKPIYDFGTFKRYALPAMYWSAMLKGLV